MLHFVGNLWWGFDGRGGGEACRVTFCYDPHC